MTDIKQLAQAVDEETRVREGAPGEHPAFDQLVRTIWRLRQPDGCPWDRVQTHKSLEQSMIEETYEAIECIEAEDDDHLREELGDMLEVLLLNTQIAADGGVAGGTDGPFTIDDVCRELNEKLVRRHPHVFGDPAAVGAVGTAGEVLDIWDDAKKQERAEAGNSGEEPGLLDSVPTSLPALMQAQKISKRAAKAGFEWETVADIWDKVAEERGEFEAEERGSEAAALEFGDLLFALVNVARREGIDAEAALAASNRKFRRRWAAIERIAREEGIDTTTLTSDQLNTLWDRAKAQTA